jgi:hypothetical protein
MRNLLRNIFDDSYKIIYSQGSSGGLTLNSRLNYFLPPPLKFLQGGTPTTSPRWRPLLVIQYSSTKYKKRI